MRARHDWLKRPPRLALLVFFVFAAAMTLELAGVELLGDSAAVTAHRRDSLSWIALGLAAERTRDLAQAAQYFAEAEKVDRRYLPAWSSANFYFRHGDAGKFWHAAARASAMIYDDPRPLIDLADRMEPDPAMVLDRLHATPLIERAYLDFLIGKQRWNAAAAVASRMLARGDPADAGRLQDFRERRRAAGQGDAAGGVCRARENCHDRL